MVEAKSEMSILDEDAKFMDTPCRPKPSSFTALLKLKHHYGFSSCFLSRFFCSPSSAPLPPGEGLGEPPQSRPSLLRTSEELRHMNARVCARRSRSIVAVNVRPLAAHKAELWQD